MASLGSFGKRHNEPEPEEPDTFEWFGTQVRIVGAVNEVELIDLMDVARSYDTNDMAAVALLKDGLRSIVAAEDFDEFWSLARQHKQTIDDLADLMSDLMEAVIGRPTQQLSGSSPGQPSTATNSPDASPLPVKTGRPDLQLLQQEGAESRARLAARALG